MTCRLQGPETYGPLYSGSLMKNSAEGLHRGGIDEPERRTVAPAKCITLARSHRVKRQSFLLEEWIKAELFQSVLVSNDF
jgi:hypothetical protein